jgi:hypothetical protein
MPDESMIRELSLPVDEAEWLRTAGAPDSDSHTPLERTVARDTQSRQALGRETPESVVKIHSGVSVPQARTTLIICRAGLSASHKSRNSSSGRKPFAR